jgi:hypothetical protein
MERGLARADATRQLDNEIAAYQETASRLWQSALEADDSVALIEQVLREMTWPATRARSGRGPCARRVVQEQPQQRPDNHRDPAPVGQPY